MFLLIAVFLVLTYSGYFLLASFKGCNFIKEKCKVLIITAHPDDECMFFAPTILNLLRKSCDVYLLCLSTGGFYKESTKRKKELRQSCKTLGIPAGNIIIIQHSHLPDDPNLKWSRIKVGSVVLKYIIRLSIDIVISFDDWGVSGHLNHIAICESLRHLSSKRLLPQECEIFLLTSVYLLQKYIGFLLSPLTFLFSNLCCVSTAHDVRTIWKSMKDHKSQFVWFRKLYIIFSRYVYENTFVKL